MLAQNRVVQIGGDLNLAVCVEKRRQGMGVRDLERDTYQRGTDAAKVIQVIETKSVRGSGEKDQPFRTVIEYCRLMERKSERSIRLLLRLNRKSHFKGKFGFYVMKNSVDKAFHFCNIKVFVFFNIMGFIVPDPCSTL